MAVGTPLTSLMVLEGAFLMLSTPKSVTVLMVSGTVLMVLTVRSDTVLTVCGTIFTPDTAVSTPQNCHKTNGVVNHKLPLLRLLFKNIYISLYICVGFKALS